MAIVSLRWSWIFSPNSWYFYILLLMPKRRDLIDQYCVNLNYFNHADEIKMRVFVGVVLYDESGRGERNWAALGSGPTQSEETPPRVCQV